MLLMSLIERLAKLRYDNFINEFDIDISKVNWQLLKQKFIKHKLMTKHCGDLYCSLLIYNIIWKNIIVYQIRNEKCHIHMYYNNYQCTMPLSRVFCPSFPHGILIDKYWIIYPMLKENCTILQTKIINYMMLVDIIVAEHMISDLAYLLKICICDIILLL